MQRSVYSPHFAQMLASGDKITIGSTTILFEEAAKSAVSTKAPTAKIPVAAAAVPEEKPASAPSKTATAKLPVAPTRRTTARAVPGGGSPAGSAAGSGGNGG